MPLSFAERRAAAAKAVATRRARLQLIASGQMPREVVTAGRKHEYTRLDTETLLSLLPAEQAILDRFVGGMHARYTFARLAAIEHELTARNVRQLEIMAWRFGAADHDDEAASIAERVAILQEPERASIDALSFDEL